MLYEMTYKCRLCGSVYVRGGTSARQLVDDNMTNLIVFGEPKTAQGALLLDNHSCNGGSSGLADFVGYRLNHSQEELREDAYENKI